MVIFFSVFKGNFSVCMLKFAEFFNFLVMLPKRLVFSVIHEKFRLMAEKEKKQLLISKKGLNFVVFRFSMNVSFFIRPNTLNNFGLV